MTGEFASKGVAGSGLGLGIAGTVLGVLNGGLGGFNNNAVAAAVCSESTLVTRFELEQSQTISRLQTEVSLRDANTYTLGEIGKLKDHMDVRFARQGEINTTQAVWNQANTSAISCMNDQIVVLNSMTKTSIKSSAICDDCNTCCLV